MPLQYSTTLRNNQLDQVEVSAGVSAHLQLRSGAAPANCGTAASGSLLADITLPADWMSAASAASKTKLGTWTGIGAIAGTIGHRRSC
jgi:hypothetical protein